MKIDYTKLNSKGLMERLEQLQLMAVQASNVKLPSPKQKAENYSKIRREIARVRTEIRRRELNDL